MISSVATGSYIERTREARLKAVPALGLNAADVYIGATQSLAHLGATAAPVMQAGAAGLAVWHGISCIYHLNHGDTPSDKLREQTLAIGDFITGAGLIGAAAGIGVWSLPLIGIGLLTSNFARFR